jgi:hypothetical protein
MEETEIYIAVSISDGSVYHYAFQLRGRAFGPSSALAGWMPAQDGWFVRFPSKANIEFDLRKTEREQWNVERRDSQGNVLHAAVQMVSWRVMSEAEHALFTEGRPGPCTPYRNALVDRNGRIEHDMPKARECHRGHLRRMRGAVLDNLDRLHNRATGRKRHAEADAIEAKREALRNITDDPRIEAAQTIDDLKSITLPEA